MNDKSELLGVAFNRTWWINVYPGGSFTGNVWETREDALRHSTLPDAIQVEVTIVPTGLEWKEAFRQKATET
jgi:hypothetical protein